MIKNGLLIVMITIADKKSKKTAIDCLKYVGNFTSIVSKSLLKRFTILPTGVDSKKLRPHLSIENKINIIFNQSVFSHFYHYRNIENKRS